MASLMSFILNTLQGPVNDPDNPKLWLPKLLYNLKGSDNNKLLPLQADSENLGKIANSSGTYMSQQVANTWILYLNAKQPSVTSTSAIPCPSDPYPTLSFQNLVLSNLQNIYANLGTATKTTDGYQIQIPLQFNHSQKKDVAGIPMGQLNINSEYTFSTHVCTNDSGSEKCNGELSEKLTGNGKMTADLSNIGVNAHMTVLVAGTGNSRQLTLSVSELEVTGVDSQATNAASETGTTVGPNLDITDVTVTNFQYGTAFAPAIKQAFNSPEAQTAIFNSLQNVLNTPENIQSISNALLGKIGGVLNDIFGPLPTSGLPENDSKQNLTNPVDLLLFDRMRVAVGNPASNWFLPWQVASLDNPVVDPYTDSSIDVGTQVIEGLTYKDITLTDLVVANTSNINAPVDDILSVPSKINASATFGLLEKGADRKVKRNGTDVDVPVPAAPPLTIAFGFSMTQTGVAGDTPLKGTVNVQLTDVVSSFSITPSGDEASNLNLALSDFTVDLSGATVTPKVTLEPPNPFMQGFAEKVFQNDSVKKKISDAITSKINNDEGSISQSVSQAAQNAIHQQLYSQ